MYIIGISAFYHDSAASIIKDGKLIAAAQEERFTRIKHDASFPINAILYCIDEAGIDPTEIQNVVFYEKPLVKFERILETYLAYAPKGFKSFATSMPLWVKDKLFQKTNIIKILKRKINSEIDWKEKLLFSEHHLSHAASAFYPSPFNEAAILTLDGVGEWTTTSLAIGKDTDIQILKEIKFPHSIGLLYSSFTYYLGFKVNSGEYKVMGLAPYGQPRYVEKIKNELVSIKEDGSFELNMSYFDYCTGSKMTNKNFDKLFSGHRRKPEEVLSQKEMDLACSIQKVTEEIILKLCNNAAKETKQKNLCMAGGVALNCVANSKILEKNIFENVWVQPASGDSGGAIGSALSIYHMNFNRPKIGKVGKDNMLGSFLGPSFTSKEIKKQLSDSGAIFEELSINKIISETAKALSEQKVVGWMQGRMEFGPRSLGSRSILADPRSPKMQKQLNLKIKYRESFRPFAPSVLKEKAKEWFNINNDSPYMLFVSDIVDEKKLDLTNMEIDAKGLQKLNIHRSKIPAVTHVDFTSRIQTVCKEDNLLYHSLISKFYELTGCPILVNTSFNVRGEPIVCNPKDAFRCFMGTQLDILVIGNNILYKNSQKKDIIHDYKKNFHLD